MKPSNKTGLLPEFACVLDSYSQVTRLLLLLFKRCRDEAFSTGLRRHGFRRVCVCRQGSITRRLFVVVGLVYGCLPFGAVHQSFWNDISRLVAPVLRLGFERCVAGLPHGTCAFHSMLW